MNGGNIPYHLRVKKDIERRLFVEQLRLISKVYDLEEYTYIGMAGPFSEDFKLMYDRFNFKNFFSYETDENVYKRQAFNIPFTQVHYLNNKISKSIKDFPDIELKDGSLKSIEETVLWLDYTGLEYEFIDDFERAIGNFGIGSVVKITLLAYAKSLYPLNKELALVLEEREKRLKKRIGENYFFEDIFQRDNLKDREYPFALFELLKKVSNKALEGSPIKFLPISSYIYQDGMTMLTFTGIIIERDKEELFLSKTGFESWEYGLFHTPEPIKIEVPFLSLKEKYNLDACLPNPPENELDYFDEESIQSYEKFYKFYPSFAKIV